MKIQAHSWPEHASSEFPVARFRHGNRLSFSEEIYGRACNEQLFHTMRARLWPAGVGLA